MNVLATVLSRALLKYKVTINRCQTDAKLVIQCRIMLLPTKQHYRRKKRGRTDLNMHVTMKHGDPLPALLPTNFLKAELCQGRQAATK